MLSAEQVFLEFHKRCHVCRGTYRSKLKPAPYYIEQIWNTAHRRSQPQKNVFCIFSIKFSVIHISHVPIVQEKMFWDRVQSAYTRSLQPIFPLWRKCTVVSYSKKCCSVVLIFLLPFRTKQILSQRSSPMERTCAAARITKAMTKLWKSNW